MTPSMPVWLTTLFMVKQGMMFFLVKVALTAYLAVMGTTL